MFLLVEVIKGLTFNFNGHKHPSHALHEDKSDFYCYCHMGQTKNPQYLDTFKNKVFVIESFGRAIVNVPRMTNE